MAGLSVVSDRRPPPMRRAPPATASSIQDITRSASREWISGRPRYRPTEIADAQRGDACRNPLDEVGENIGVDEDALDRNANLSGVIVAALHDGLDDPIQFRTAIDDDRRRTAMFQRAARSRRVLAAQMPAHPCGPDEAQKGDTWIRRKTLCQCVVLGDEALTPWLGEAGLAKQGNKLQTAQRGRRGRLDDHRATDGDRRAHLENKRVERVVERGYRGNDANRLPCGEGPSPVARRREAHRNLAAGDGGQARFGHPSATRP